MARPLYGYYMKNIKNRLNIYFIFLSIFSVIIYSSVFLYHRRGGGTFFEGETLRTAGLVFFILAIACGVAGPILLRVLIQDRMVKSGALSAGEYLNHNLRINAVTMLAVIFSGVNYFLAVPDLYLYGSVLAAIYGIYGIIPVEKKIAAEVRYYRIEMN